MKDKIKARYDEFKNDPFSQGILVGGAIALTTTIVMKANFDHKGLYIPKRIVKELKETNGYVLAQKDGVDIVLALVPQS